jgi:hypothetical protein
MKAKHGNLKIANLLYLLECYFKHCVVRLCMDLRLIFNAVFADVLLVMEAARKILHDGKYICPICRAAISNRFNLRVHLETQHGSDKHPTRCHLCGIFSKNKNALRRHIQRRHRNMP